MAYRDSWLWLPKTKFPESYIKAALDVERPDGTLISLWHDAGTHFMVPRSFRDEAFLKEREVELRDLRPSEFAPMHGVQDNIILRNDKRGNQLEAFAALADAGDGLLVLGCGKGKTPLSLKVAAHMNVSTLVIVHTEAMMQHWAEEIELHLGIPRDKVGRIYGKEFSWDAPIAVAMIHSTSFSHLDWPPELTRRWGLVIFDEVHVLGAPVFSQAAPMFPGRRLGLTGTYMRDDNMEPIYLYHCGPVLHMDVEQSIKPKTVFQHIDTEMDLEDEETAKSVLDSRGDIHAVKLATWLGNNPGRLDHVEKMIRTLEAKGRKLLVLCRATEPLYTLGARLSDLNTVVVTGKTKSNRKGPSRLDMIRGSRIALCTDKIGDTGLNDTAMDTVVWLTPPGTGSRDDDRYMPRQITQSYGRLQREGGDHDPLVIVLEDTKIPICRAMCFKIRRALRALDYPAKIRRTPP